MFIGSGSFLMLFTPEEWHVGQGTFPLICIRDGAPSAMTMSLLRSEERPPSTPLYKHPTPPECKRQTKARALTLYSVATYHNPFDFTASAPSIEKNERRSRWNLEFTLNTPKSLLHARVGRRLRRAQPKKATCTLKFAPHVTHSLLVNRSWLILPDALTGSISAMERRLRLRVQRRLNPQD